MLNISEFLSIGRIDRSTYSLSGWHSASIRIVELPSYARRKKRKLFAIRNLASRYATSEIRNQCSSIKIIYETRSK